jgi:hypothetical protein
VGGAQAARRGRARDRARGAEAAVRLLERACREPCDEAALQLALGRAYRLVGRLDDASAALESASRGVASRARAR